MIISLITVKNLTLAYGDKNIVDDLSFSLAPGDFLVVIGDNGVGKTTLVRSLLGQLKPKKGVIEMPDKLKIGYVPQFRNLDEEYPLSIKDFVALNAGKSLRPWLNQKERQQLHHILELTDLTRIQDRLLGQASGGEKQRVVLARALTQSPKILILDEPTNHLDIRYRLEILSIIKDLQITVLAALHDLSLAAQFCDYLYLMKQGEIVTQGMPEAVMTSENLHSIFDVEACVYPSPINGKLMIQYL